MTTRVVRGGVWNLSGQGATLLAAFVATPFTIRLLGSDAYGVLALINAVVGYMAVSDLGMGVASTKFGADARSRNDADAESAAVWTSLLIGVVPSLLAAAGLTLGAGSLVSVMGLPEHLREAAVWALRIGSVGIVARAAASVMNTPQLARLRIDLYTMITSGTAVLQVCFVPVVLALGGDLRAAVGVVAAGGVVMALAHGLVSTRLLPEMIRPRFSRALARRLVIFGGSVVVSSIVTLLLAYADKLLVARFASVTALAHYSVAYAMSTILLVVPFAFAPSLLPAFSNLLAQSDREKVQRLYNHTFRGNLLWVVPAAVVITVVAEPFLTLWAGPEFGRESTMPLYILVVGVSFEVVTNGAYNALLAANRADLVARYQLVELLPYLLLAGFLISRYGAAGAAAAYTLRSAIHGGLLLVTARRTISSLRPFSTRWPSYAVALGSLVLPVLVLGQALAHTTFRIGIVLLSVAAYSTIVWTRVLTDEERTWLGQMTRLRAWVNHAATLPG
jgi:O-antigen/teichoic acid export membrane protein